MKHTQRVVNIQGILSGICAALAVTLVSTFAANKALDSKLFLQSRFISSVLSADTVGLSGFIANKKNYDVFAKFLGAVTAAYINFELIPVNEARTFVAVFENITPDITIESFSYQGKVLVITGMASDQESCEKFRGDLMGETHFESVSIHSYTTVDGDIRFVMDCAPADFKNGRNTQY